MAKKKFIKISNMAGDPIYVNTNLITCVYKTKNYTAIEFVGSDITLTTKTDLSCIVDLLDCEVDVYE